VRKNTNVVSICHSKLQRDAIAALKSNEFTPYRGALRVQTRMRGTLFCASGVLCEVYRQHYPETSLWTRPNNAYYSFHVHLQDDSIDARRYDLPNIVRNAYGLTAKDAREIVIMNDGHRLHFVEIADWLAERWGKQARAA